MHEFAALFAITTALAAGVISPGPSFVLVARTSVAASRAHGLANALGMAIGGMLFATAALLGLQGLLLAAPILFITFKIIGGIYLAYLGIRIWRGAKQPIADTVTVMPSGSFMRSLATGLVTQVSNPKAAIVYASVFAAFLPAQTSLWFGLTLVAIVFCIEGGWYAIIAIALSASKPRAAYLRFKSALDRMAGTVMIGLGLKLAWSGLRS